MSEQKNGSEEQSSDENSTSDDEKNADDANNADGEKDNSDDEKDNADDATKADDEKKDIDPKAENSSNSQDSSIKNSSNIKKKDSKDTDISEEVDPDLPEAKPMTLMQHLGELRTRLVRSAIVIAMAFVLCYGVADLIFAELMRPLVKVLPEGSKLIFTSLPEAFFLELQVGFVAAIFVASPFIFYQIWSFIAPGLYDEEKKYTIPIAIISAFFFICGAAFCYFVVFPFSFDYFMSFATDEIVPMPSISQYFSFTLKILIAFGLIFEMPLFTFFLARMGIVTAEKMRKIRKYSVLVIFIVAAILTPPDVISQLLMAIPMIFLYELSIYIAVCFGKKPKNSEENDKDKDEDEKSAKDKKNAKDDKNTKDDNIKKGETPS